MKRIISMVLALVMAFSAMPLNVFGYEGYTLNDEQLTDNATSELDMERFYSFSEDVGLGRIHVSATYSPVLTYASGYMSEGEAALSLRENMKNRVSNFTIKFQSSAGPNDILRRMLDLAAAHTGVPTEGDYIMWQFSSIGADFAYGYGGGYYYYEIPFRVSYFTTKAQENQVNTAVQKILQELNVYNSPDYDKIFAVYDYICKTVTYDYDNLNDNTYLLKHSAYAAFIDKTVVCQGYALMLYRLMLELGIDCRIITGTSFGEHHAWNIVKLDGKYYNLDSTWDAGYSQYIYFLKNQANFNNHERDTEFTTSEFNQKYPMADEDNADALFTIINGELVAYNGVGIADVVIPDGVTSIGYGVFENNHDIVTVTIPEGVTTIEGRAFWSCRNLKSVAFPSSLESIGGNAFGRCDALLQINIPEKVTAIGNSAFESCDSLVSVTLPEGLTSLGTSAFRACPMLESINIPSSLTSIQDATFELCYALKEVVLHENIVSVGNYAFYNFYGTIKFMNSETVIFDSSATIGNGATIYGYNTSTAGNYARKWSKNFVPFDPEAELPVIASGTCGDNLTWEIDPDYNLIIKGTGEMTSAPWTTEYGKSIKHVTLEEGVTSICDNAFSFSNITGITLPSTLEYIGKSVFYYCGYLESISLPYGLITIDEDAFASCHKLTEVVIPDSVTTLGQGVFDNSYNIKSVVLSKNLETIPEDAFSGCSKLTDIVIPNSVKTIGESAFKSTGLVNLVIPDSVTEIGEYSFSNIYSLKSLTISNNLTSIPAFAFNYCPELTSITIPDSVTSIGRSAFYHCTALTEVVIPKNVTNIGMDAFYYCNNIEKVYVYSHTATIHQSDDTFPESATIYGYDNSTAQAYAKMHQRVFVSLGAAPLASGTCGDNVKWLLTADGTLTISGEGEMCDYEYSEYSHEAPWMLPTPVKKVVIDDGVTHIGDHAFYDCSELESVIISDSVKSIGEGAFRDCTGLTEIEMSDGLTSIDDLAFSNCKLLPSIQLPDSVSHIGISAFKNCESFTSFVIPAGVENIEDYTFSYCTRLKSIVIPDGVKSIGTFVFNDCVFLSKVDIPESVEFVGSGAFKDCARLERVIFRSAETVIHDSPYVIPENTVIYGHKNSTAQAYAGKYGREFVDLSTLYTVGDLDGNDRIDNNDAIYLLYYTIFGEEGGYTVNQPCDFDGSGEVDNNDAIYLLYHTIFGADEYPLS